METRENVKEKIFLFLEGTAKIFDLVKKYSILIEEKLPEHKAPIHAANELKSLMFHLYHTVEKPEQVDTNILEAKEHLCRAFYDLHGIAISAYIEQIKKSIKEFKIKTVATILPEYASTIRPQINRIQEQLRDIRSDRNTNIELLVSDIDIFDEQIKAMNRFEEIIEEAKADLTRHEDEEATSKKKDRKWDFSTKVIIVLLSVSLGSVAGYFIPKKASTIPIATPNTSTDTAKILNAKKHQ